MGFFNRRAAPADPNTANSVGNGHVREKRGRHSIMGKHERRATYGNDTAYNKRPSFGQWLKGTWLDILTMAAMGAIGLGIYEGTLI